jgi:hypothetical protein
MEINLQFDNNGRTRCEIPDGVIDYAPKATMTKLVQEDGENDNRQLMDDLLFDCEIADCGLMPRTFWMPVDGTSPTCTLEKMALDVFHHHIAGAGDDFDKSTSGAEWWVQLRPSPPNMGRYAMHDDSEPDIMSKSGISFHWDKDEDLRLLAGGNLYVHPHISTVTYLTSIGAPTMVCNQRINALTGEWVEPDQEEAEGYLSWPRTGKHLSFDGGFLHAAPPNLMKDGEFDEQCVVPETIDDKQRKLFGRRHRRVTFLVNIWLNYKPLNVERFPMLEKLSKLPAKDWQLFADNATELPATPIPVDDKKTAKKLTWPMGGCDSKESITMLIPVEQIRETSSEGPNLHIAWSKDAPVVLSKGERAQPPIENDQQGLKRETDEERSKKEKYEKRQRPL